jgi:hypothetical protein
MPDQLNDALPTPRITDRPTFETELDALRLREKAHTHEEMPLLPLAVACQW